MQSITCMFEFTNTTQNFQLIYEKKLQETDIGIDICAYVIIIEHRIIFSIKWNTNIIRI